MLKVLWWALPSSIREFIIVRTPGRIGRLPYWSAYFFVRLDLWLHFRGSVEVWPRHSFVLGSHEPFRSDLDLTIWSKGSVDRQRAQKIALILNRGRQLFPWIGESNLYDEVHAAKFMTYMNFFEFSRDPFLGLKKVEECSDLSLRTQAAVFLFRALEADWINLRAHPSRRQKKWSQHLGMMKRFKIPEVDRIFRQGLSLEGIIRCIVSIAGFAPEFTEEYCQGLMSYYSRKDLAIDSTSELSDRLIWYFLPQKFSYVGSPPNPGEAAGWDFFLGQMAWEVWGLNAQFFWLEKPSLLQHLENLSSALVKAPLSAQQRIFSRGLEQQISTLQGRIHTEVS